MQSLKELVTKGGVGPAGMSLKDILVYGGLGTGILVQLIESGQPEGDDTQIARKQNRLYSNF
jgi:hypothetical protein